MHVSLAFNPSHLEWVNTVVQGRVRAKQDRVGDSGRTRCLPLLIHGDAAFAGQGIIAEALNMSELDGYRVGGTVHIIVNNQVGFTTSPRDAKSTTYATDVARMLQIPIFHVNGEDPEAVSQVVDLAVDFRQRFHRDAIIELWCYRKLGHNEGDEPSYTQPVMYRTIAAQAVHPDGVPGVRRGEPDARRRGDDHRRGDRRDRRGQAARAGGAAGHRDEGEVAAAAEHVRGRVVAASRAARTSQVPEVPTAATPAEIQEVTRAISTMPADFHVHPKLKVVVVDGRAAMGAGEKPIDWGMGEALAFGTLLAEGTRVRLSGQDSRRGTFSHRHAVLLDYNDGHEYTPLAHIRDKQGTFEVRDSPLSEAGVLGFDFGYSLDMPDGLTIWEAQFGDFVNARAGDHRSVPVLVGGEVAPRERPGDAAAARHGGAGARALERAARSLPEPVRQRQHAGLQPDDAGAVLPRAAAAGAAALPQAADHHVAEEPAALAGGDVAAGGFHGRIVPAHHPRHRRAAPSRQRDPKKVKRVVLCTGKVYYDLVADPRGTRLR